jgi:prepilin-type N-terminal cleavage/methylation domain-containing protein
MSAKSRQSLLRAKLAQHILSASKGFTLIELLVVIVIVGMCCLRWRSRSS